MDSAPYYYFSPVPKIAEFKEEASVALDFLEMTMVDTDSFFFLSYYNQEINEDLMVCKVLRGSAFCGRIDFAFYWTIRAFDLERYSQLHVKNTQYYNLGKDR